MYGFESFYFFFFIFYFFYTLLIRSLSKIYKGSSLFLFLIFFPLFFLAAMRGDTVGGDLRNYLPHFYEICKESDVLRILVSGYEPGYSLLIKLISLVSPSPRAFLVITSFLSLIGPSYLICKYSNNILVSILLYCMMTFYTNTFNIIRQSIAVSIFFISIPYLINRKVIPYYILSIIAVSMHFSAIVLFLVYPIVKKAINLKKVLLILAVTIILYILAGNSLLYNLIALLFVKYDPSSVLDTKSGTGWNLLILYSFVFVFCFLIYEKRKGRMVTKEKMFFSMMIYFLLLVSCFQLFATKYSTTMRMRLYFFIPIIVMIPRFYSLSKTTVAKFVIICLTTFLCFHFINTTYSYQAELGSDANGVIPYIFLK